MRYIENWRKHNSASGLTSSVVGLRQSGMNYVAYLCEHPGARCKRTLSGSFDKRKYVVKTKWRGGICPATGIRSN